MSEPDLRSAARELERQVPPADFSTIAQRGRAVRRRRRVLQAGAAAAAVAVVTVGLTVPWDGGEGADRPPVAADSRTERVLQDPSAVVDDAATAVTDTGAVLHLVRAGSPAGGSCRADRRSAFVWHGPDGGRTAWSDAVAGREVAPVPGGFVVGAVTPGCQGALGGPDVVGAYVVDEDGARSPVDWAPGAEERCATRPEGPRCVVEVDTASGRFVDPPVVAEDAPAGAVPVSADGQRLWARSTDGRTLHWSRDGGRSWSSRRTSLGGQVAVAAAGPWAMFFSWPARAEVTRDGGRSWEVRDLGAALEPFVMAQESWTLTPEGHLVAVSTTVGTGSFLVASTDPTWSEFVRAEISTELGALVVERSGSWLYVADLGATWRSGDGGRSWERLDPLG